MAVWIYRTPLIILIYLKLIQVSATKDEFHEELYIKPLASSHVYTYFQFTTLFHENEPSYNHCNLFPRALGELLHRYHIEELHLTLTSGIWRHEIWGYPVSNGAPGVELIVWFKETTPNVDESWKDLASSLSGLLCASLNFIDASNSVSPKFSFRPQGILRGNSSFLRYGTLPQEIVCTENLTPWKKLLPCDSHRGLATLLNAGYVHNTNYHSLGIHVRNICRDPSCQDISVELKQTVALVYDLVIIENGEADFSLRKLFGSGLNGVCPLADVSRIYVDITSNGTDGVFTLVPAPHKVSSERSGIASHFAVYDIKALQLAGMFNIAVTYKRTKIPSVRIIPLLSATRFVSGYGKERGGIVTKITNRHWQPLNVVLLENIPWFLPVYLHTLKLTSNGKEIKPVKVEYIPGRQRVRPTYLEVLFRVPARSQMQLSIDFDYVFLKWQEYPPDASHGFYVGSSVLTSLLPLPKNYTGLPQNGSLFLSSFNASQKAYLIELRTESLIITLPTPDFSMPYNVICLTCTVVALAFGPIHNITTKRLRIKENKPTESLVTRLLVKLKLKKPG